MLLNVILVVVGLIICFGGIYLRRVCSALMGFVWGVLAAFVVALMTVGIWGIGDDSTTIAIFIAGIVFAVLSAIYYKACAAINGFLSSATIVMLLLLASDGIDSETVAFIIAIVIGIICATISVKFYDYSFIITTALSGGLVASIGGFGIIHGDDLEDTLTRIVWYGGRGMAPVILGTLILGIIGFIVQLRRLRAAGSQTN